jgi:hypothetical protein
MGAGNEEIISEVTLDVPPDRTLSGRGPLPFGKTESKIVEAVHEIHLKGKGRGRVKENPPPATWGKETHVMRPPKNFVPIGAGGTDFASMVPIADSHMTVLKGVRKSVRMNWSFLPRRKGKRQGKI